MGGSAIKTVSIKRLPKEEFEPYTRDVVSKLLTKFSYASPLRYYHNKPDFGDLDIVMNLSEDKSRDDTTATIIELFNSREIHKNGNTYSFEYKKFQVDLIFTKDEDIQSTEFYFSYNDLNNLVGRIAHKFDLKFGFDGLNFVIRDHHGSLFKRILISKDERKIYEFLGLSYGKFLQGFDEVSDIFDFVISSPYFDSEIFNYENLNHQNRTRNKKRKNYAGFLEYLQKHNICKSYPFEKDKSKYIQVIDTYFPEAQLIKRLDEIQTEFQYQRSLREKFNGDLVMKLTGLHGKDLGKFIYNFKKQYHDFQEYIETKPKEEIMSDIIYYLVIHKK
jgi:hypothetical protein